MTGIDQQTRTAAALTALILALGLATISGAWFFQLVIDLVPCQLCLQQRWPYYIGLPLAAIALYLLIIGGGGLRARIILLLVAAIFLVGAGLGIYHAGVEWSFWPGPTSCATGAGSPQNAGSLLSQMASTKVVPCDEAAWRLMGISMAGYNALISLFLVFAAAIAARRTK